MASDIPIKAPDAAGRVNGVGPPLRIAAPARPPDAGGGRDGATAAVEGETVGRVLSGLNDLVQNLHRNLQFSVDDESGDTVIKVIDSETDEVLRQIPSEEIIRLRRRLEEAAGVLFRETV